MTSANNLELVAENLQDENGYRDAAFITARRSPPKVEWSGAGRSVRPARTAGSPDGNEQQGLEAGFEQKAGRKRLDAGHSQSVGIPTG